MHGGLVSHHSALRQSLSDEERRRRWAKLFALGDPFLRMLLYSCEEQLLKGKNLQEQARDVQRERAELVRETRALRNHFAAQGKLITERTR